MWIVLYNLAVVVVVFLLVGMLALVGTPVVVELSTLLLFLVRWLRSRGRRTLADQYAELAARADIYAEVAARMGVPRADTKRMLFGVRYGQPQQIDRALQLVRDEEYGRQVKGGC